MPNIVIPNTMINSSGEKFHAVWKLTRGMLAAGWKYKAGADALEKEVTGDPSKDLWSVGGYTNLTTIGGQSGSAVSFSVPIVATGTSPPDIKLTGTPTAPFNFVIQITTSGTRGVAIFRWSSDGGNTFTSNVTTAASNSLGATGVTINFPNGTYTNDNVWTMTNTFPTVTGLTGMTANSVGHALVLSGGATSATNGTFRIASFLSSTSVTVYNPFAGGLTALQNAGIAASITTVVGTTVTLTGGANFTAASVGHYITITGAASAGNNGTFLITTFISSTSVSYTNASGVATDANNPNIHWVESAVNVSTSPAIADPYVDLSSGSITWSEQDGGGTAAVSSVTNGIATITGLSGMTANSVGHLVTFNNAASTGNNGTFMVVAFVSSSSVKILNTAAVAGDTNNGSITWTERNPASDNYPAHIQSAFGVGSWIVLQGPSTMKIPIGTNLPSTSFIRGEKVTQAATGCEGEILGVVTDATGGTGFLVIAPRVNGSGGGPRGWDTSSIAAQAAPAGSGATITPSATAIEYVREIVIWKNTASTGHWYYQCIDQSSAESSTTNTTGRFSTMASTLSQVTFTVCPAGSTGGSPVSNGFPTIGTMCVSGTGGAGAVTTGSSDLFMELVTVTGMIQIAVANNIEGTGVSQDGSWTLAVGTSTTSPGTFTANCFMRLDDTEDGDVDPYVLYFPTTTGPYTRSRTVGGNSALTGTTDFFNANTSINGSLTSHFLGWRRRGFAIADAFQEFGGWLLNTAGGTQNAMGGGGQANSFGYPDSIAHTFQNPAPRVREPIWIMSVNVSTGQPITAGFKMRKGTMRWWYAVSGGNGTDTLDGKRWVQGGAASATAANFPIVFGPWDGTTAPLNG